VTSKKDIKKDLTFQLLPAYESKIIQKTYIYINYKKNGVKPQKIYIRSYYNLIGAKRKMKKEQKYYYGNAISEYGMEHGYVDYATLAKCFDAVLNNDIMSLTYDIGSWKQVSGTIDNSDEIEEFEEKRDELEKENENNPSQIIENEINGINEQIEVLENEQNDDSEVFQWFIVDDCGARLLHYINEIVYYNEKLDMYVWGVTHYGTSWSYVLTNIKIDW
jgi:hypothetical protein